MSAIPTGWATKTGAITVTFVINIKKKTAPVLVAHPVTLTSVIRLAVLYATDMLNNRKFEVRQKNISPVRVTDESVCVRAC